ncbi:iron-containing alcohol dehydrogenase [Tuanshanicoccus lijuaniae]|uniref:iron-containing alcohol dehydrogenase n=1 Tax=Aerococcaceae bacterium zg-1292 TaxID=2774330 RepID=UPI0019365551|nr:iron-containing alcohol dehydrogenase [Aerococcaceae bacterium zg-1292]QQA36608.1 iron-containing alcohol dehydrogenase [Aerococcaceae bacterium zg-1292]
MLPMRPMKMGGDYLIFGENSLEYLKELDGEKAIIVHDGFFLKESGYFEEIKQYLVEAGFQVDEFSGIESDPSFATVLKGAEKMKSFNPDWIIAVGGGSVMDAAKAMWIYYEHPEMNELSQLVKPIPKLREKAKMCCIPTSSGTGSEVSRSVVISDSKTHKKNGVGDMEMMPDIAILEPKLTISLPKSITAATGMDALTHAIEARVSRRSNMVADALADKAIREIYKNIITAFKEPENIHAREKMLISATISGIAFTNVSLGIVHSLSHPIGGKFNVPHGLSNAIILPYVIEFNSQDKETKRIYDEIAQMLDKNRNLVEIVEELNKQLNIPKTLKEYINNDIEFESNIQELAKDAMADGCTKTNPIIPTINEFEDLFRKCYYG